VCRKNSAIMQVANPNSDPASSELTSALALLDKEWQKNQNKNNNRWEKLDLADGDSINMEFVYLLRPPANFIRPTSVIFFLGGAALGQFPHIAYSEMLTRISNSLGAAVIAAPFATGLDHFELAKETGELFRRSMIKCEEELQWPIEKLPRYALAHSLGAKLTIINIAATDFGEDLQGIGLVSYNNFGLSKSVGMAKTFVDSIRQTTASSANAGMMDTLFEFAEQVTQGIGLDFQPNPEVMDRLVTMKLSPTLQRKTRLFCFDEDGLDCSERLLECCQSSEGASMTTAPTVSGLPGTHLTPVFLKLGVDDLDGVPDEAKEMAGEVIGFESASFGNEQDLNGLVREVCSWVTGKAATRGPKWGATREPEYARRLSGAMDAEIESS